MIVRILLLLCCISLLNGCGRSEPTNFYVLTPHHQKIRSKAKRVVIVGPVLLPSYLEQPQYLVRKHPNQLQLAEFDRWLQPLDENITLVLIENLQQLLPNYYLFAYGDITDTDFKANYQIRLDVKQIETDAMGNAKFTLRWEVWNEKGKRIKHKLAKYQADKDPGLLFPEITAQLSEFLARLSTDIAMVVI